jgi:hypothetical protein
MFYWGLLYGALLVGEKVKDMTRSPLNRSSAPNVIRFFDICFKQGVVDAYNFSDDYSARDFVEKHKAAWDFGVLGEPDDYDWEMWRFTLYRWARRHRLVSFSRDFIYRIVKKNPLWYFLPYCMYFYLMGIKEWLEYPNPVPLEVFKSENRVHWAPVLNYPRKITTDDYISMMQECCLEYRRSPISAQENPPMLAGTLDAYCQAIHDLTRKYATGKKLRIQDLC